MAILSSKHRHSTGVTALSLATAMASVFGLNGTSPWVLVVVIVSIALVGVPHGALDHWTGHKLMRRRFGSLWSVVFFGSYLAVAILTVAGWLTVPLVTALAFFVISAWHFGLEDERSEYPGRIMKHLAAIGIGGLVIWVPALAQPERMSEILKMIVPRNLFSVPAIMSATQTIACCAVPVAVVAAFRDVRSGQGRRAFRNVAFAFVFAVGDPLIGFTVYFCGWHSIRGLSGLARTHRQSPLRMAVATAPLTLGALMLSVIGLWFLRGNASVSDASVRTLFISLSAIAVPHLVLHGPVSDWFSRRERIESGVARHEVVTWSH